VQFLGGNASAALFSSNWVLFQLVNSAYHRAYIGAMDLRTPWTAPANGQSPDPAVMSPGVADPGVPPEHPSARPGPDVTRPLVIGVSLVIAFLATLALLSHGSHAHAASSSGQTGATRAPATPSGRPDGDDFTFGTVVSNDGATLRIHVLFSKSIRTVHTDRSTRILIPLNTRVPQLAVASNIAVYGTRYSDGSLVAGLIVGGL
jgi:hypothetical protein